MKLPIVFTVVASLASSAMGGDFYKSCSTASLRPNDGSVVLRAYCWHDIRGATSCQELDINHCFGLDRTRRDEGYIVAQDK